MLTARLGLPFPTKAGLLQDFVFQTQALRTENISLLSFAFPRCLLIFPTSLPPVLSFFPLPSRLPIYTPVLPQPPSSLSSPTSPPPSPLPSLPYHSAPNLISASLLPLIPCPLSPPPYLLIPTTLYVLLYGTKALTAEPNCGVEKRNLREGRI